MDITEFLLARIAEDEAVARAAIAPRVNISSPDGRWRFIDAGYNGTWPRSVELGYDDPEDIVWAKEAWAVHASRHDPARVLRECAVKRAIITQAEVASDDRVSVIQEFCVGMAESEAGYATDPGKLILESLASIYSDHPDYQKDWAL